MKLSEIILQNLITNKDYCKQIIPFVKNEYFETETEKHIHRSICEYVSKYSTVPSFDAIYIDLSSNKSVSEHAEKEIDVLLGKLKVDHPVTSHQWLLDQTEKYCQERAVYNGLTASVEIFEKKKNVGEILEIFKSALSVTFDNKIGHDYFNDAVARWEYYTKPEFKIPFKLDYMNKITGGGVSRKTLNLIIAPPHCVEKSTPIKIRYATKEFQWKYLEVAIEWVKHMFIETIVEVFSPDGWVEVTDYIEKGIHELYECVDLVTNKKVQVSANHLFETINGWQFAKDINKVQVLTENGYHDCTVRKTSKTGEIVDITVNHENHRYYTNTISSHNSGKTAHMCSLSADNLSDGKNVLYITNEMAEEEIASRIDANLFDIDLDTVKTMNQDNFERKINSLKGKTLGRLIIKEYPTSTAHVGMFRALIDDLKLKQNFTPDIIYIDYLNICAAQGLKMGSTVNSYTLLKVISEELRGLAVERDLPIYTATQVNRGNFASSDINMDDIAESFALAFIVDFAYALIVTEEMIPRNQVLVKQAKNRYADKNVLNKFFLGFRRSKMQFFNLDNPEEGLIDDKTPNIDTSSNKEKFSKFNF